MSAAEQRIPDAFQVCGSCRTAWATAAEFLADRDVRLLGLQAVLNLPEASLLMFEHRCGSSVSVLTRRLQHLLPPDGSEGWPSLRWTEECPGHCHSLPDHDACDRHCVHARDRRLLRAVEALQREATAAPGSAGR